MKVALDYSIGGGFEPPLLLFIMLQAAEGSSGAEQAG